MIATKTINMFEEDSVSCLYIFQSGALMNIQII